MGRTVSDRTDVPVESGTDPASATPPEVASAQRQLRLLQWAVPALTGALVVVSSYAGEQQRQAAGAPAAAPRGFFVRFTR